MDARRNYGHTIPVMQIAPTNITTQPAKSVKFDHLEDETAAFEDIDINLPTNRMVDTNEKGKFEVYRTECMKRFPDQPHKHLLNCGDVVETKTIMACGVNCKLRPKAKNRPKGNLIRCGACIDKKKAASSPLLPRKRPRRNSAPEGMIKMDLDDAKPAFAQPSKLANEDQLRTQLAAAFQGHEQRKSIFEPAPPNNPRKRRAVEEPGFHLHDHPTGEPQKRRGAISPPDWDQLAATRKSATLNEDTPSCFCDYSKDEQVLLCVWCGTYYHPTCVGYPELTHHQYSMYACGKEKFYCQGCKGDREEVEYRKKATKKAKQVERANKNASAAVVMMEVDEERTKKRDVKERRQVKERRERKVKKEVTKGKAKKGGDAEKMEVVEGKKPLKSILKNKTNNALPPPRPQARYKLTDNKVSRRKSMEMDVDQN